MAPVSLADIPKHTQGCTITSETGATPPPLAIIKPRANQRANATLHVICTIVLGGIPVLLVIHGILLIPLLIPGIYYNIVILLHIFPHCPHNFLFKKMSTDDFVAKKGTTSFVWNFFGVKKNNDSDKDTAFCRLCRKSVLARGDNTSNLTSHLRNNHAKEYATVSQVK